MEFYRYYDILSTSGPKIYLEVLKLVKETPRGYWIANCFFRIELSTKRWVSKTSRKRYAYPSKELALTSFLSRKERQIEILESRIKNAKIAFELAKAGRVEP